MPQYSGRRNLVLNLSKYDYFDCSLKVLEKIDGFEILDKRLWRILLLLIFRQFYMWNFIGLLYYDTGIFTYSSARFKSLKVAIPCRLPKSLSMKQAFTFFLY